MVDFWILGPEKNLCCVFLEEMYVLFRKPLYCFLIYTIVYCFLIYIIVLSNFSYNYEVIPSFQIVDYLYVVMG